MRDGLKKIRFCLGILIIFVLYLISPLLCAKGVDRISKEDDINSSRGAVVTIRLSISVAPQEKVKSDVNADVKRRVDSDKANSPVTTVANDEKQYEAGRQVSDLLFKQPEKKEVPLGIGPVEW